MKVTFERDLFLSAVGIVMTTVSTTNTMEAAKGILISAEADGSCVLRSFDMEKGIIYPIHGTVEEPGSRIIDGQLLSRIIRTMNDDITLNIAPNGQAVISSGETVSTVLTLAPDLFPNTPQPVGDVSCTFPASELKASFTQVAYAASVNDPRPFLNGMLFRAEESENETVLTLAATDSFRLAVNEKHYAKKDGVGGKMSAIVPTKTVSELVRLIPDEDTPVTLLATSKHMVFEFPDFTFFSRLVEGKYVDFEKFIPKNPTVFAEMNTSELRAAVDSVSVFADDAGGGKSKSFVACTFSGSQLTMNSSAVKGSSRASVSCTVTGGEMKIGFSCRFLSDALRYIDTPKVKFSMAGAKISAVLNPISEESDEEKKKRLESTGVTEEHRLHLIVPLFMQ